MIELEGELISHGAAPDKYLLLPLCYLEYYLPLADNLELVLEHWDPCPRRLTPAVRARARVWRGRLLPFSIGLCLLGVLLVGGCTLSTSSGAPWATHCRAVHLDRQWVGEFTVPSGTRFALVLNLRRVLPVVPRLQREYGASGALVARAQLVATITVVTRKPPLAGLVRCPAAWRARAVPPRSPVDRNQRQHPQPGLHPAYSIQRLACGTTLTSDAQRYFYDPIRRGWFLPR